MCYTVIFFSSLFHFLSTFSEPFLLFFFFSLLRPSSSLFPWIPTSKPTYRTYSSFINPPKNTVEQPYNPNQSYQIDTFDSFYIHPSDNLGLAITSPSTNNTNYHYWSHSIKLTLDPKIN